MSIQSKLLVNALVSIVCLLVIGGAGLFTIDRVAKVSFSLFETGALPVIRINEVEKNAQEFMIRLIIHCAVSEHERMEKIEQKIDKLSDEPVFKEYKAELHAFQKEWKQFVQIAGEILQLSREFSKEDALSMFVEKGRSAYDKALSVLRSDIRNHEQQMEILRNEASESRKNAVIQIAIFTFLAGLMAFSGGMLIARSIYGPVSRIVSGLSETMNRVASVSGRILFSSQQLAEDSSKHSASLEETTSSLEEMSSMTRQNADNANEADSLMKQTGNVVSQANNSMNRLTVSMEEISKASKNTSRIIKTIDEIAFQTNLLALNAAIEAARAGETGAGFAVVADEVRNLAIRATEAAKYTASLIEETIRSVRKGSEMVTKANEAFSYVLESTSKAGSLVSEIALTSGGQALGIEEVNKAVAQMDKVVQQNASNTEEFAGASEEMYSQSKYLEGFADELTLLVNGTNPGQNISLQESVISPARLASASEIEGKSRTIFQPTDQPGDSAGSPPAATGV